MQKVLVTGACGFVGTCLTNALLCDGFQVIGVDNLSRRGSELNALELTGKRFALHRVDLSQTPKVMQLFSEIGPVDAVFHLAAQVAVTTSYVDRQKDFFDNALASFNVIEAVKRYSPEAYCLYSSTNKVYGHLQVWQPVGSDYPLDPYTPYGVSKAVGDLYFNEYGRKELGLETCVLRQSCIYGHHQFGVEDQGWVAWFAIANILRRAITIYGDGTQVRDLLYVDDLVELYRKCFQQRLTGAYPVGGGTENAISLNDALDLIEEFTGQAFVHISHSTTRPGDQPYFVADLAWTCQTNLDWRPRTPLYQGMHKMIDWICEHRSAIQAVLGN
jgi:CDP-paratose 2-epimerase